MVQVKYDWPIPLQDHTRRKLKVLREYLSEYINVRCSNYKMTKFRFAIVDGFAGGGLYLGGEPGSPVIILEELRYAVNRINTNRAVDGMKPLDIECLVILNDKSPEAIKLLTDNCATPYALIKEDCPRLHVDIIYMCGSFESGYCAIKDRLYGGRYQNVLFNLDQCGVSHVPKRILLDIMSAYHRPEIFLTFMIESVLAYLTKGDVLAAERQLKFLDVDLQSAFSRDEIISKNQWLGIAESMVFAAFSECAPFVSTFSINNPGGWRYWLIQFASVSRARQVYNDILHDNATEQAHFGRSGLFIPAYDPEHEKNSLYLFDLDGRVMAREQLMEDIPRLINENGDTMFFNDFLRSVYRMTPAHDADIRSTLIENADLEVITPNGGSRRVPTSITTGDTIRLKPQKSFFPMFLGGGAAKEKT